MEQFREKGQPAYIEWLRDQIEKEWVDLALECAERTNEKAGQ
jgi:hypothetical protein